MDNPAQTWWRSAVIYQVYPRSFKDSNGDGIGDLAGIIEKLDYIASLGVDILWINPVYASPDRDNGYDISDFTSIQPQMGTMEDLERLIWEVHDKDMKIIMDMVINHTSDEHGWFRQARTSRENPYYSFYHWWPEENGQPPYRCGFFDPEGKGWHYNEATRSWYLHYFSAQQPDLNWENPAVRESIYGILRFWLGKGIDGFRLDAVTFISKDISWPGVTEGILQQLYDGDWGHYYAAGPHLHEYLHEMHEKVLQHYHAVTIAEAPGIRAGQSPLFVDPARKELDMICHFEGIMVGYLPGEFKKMDPAGVSVKELKEIYTRWDNALEGKGWNTIYLGNHDQPRMISHWGDDNESCRELSAKMLFTFLLTMRAIPFIYNGDEIGMVNIRFERIEDYQDIETRHIYQQLKDKGADVQAFLKDQQLAARDNSRTPFQWDHSPNAGFTTGKPWMKVNDNYKMLNAAAQERSPSSLLNFVRYLIRLRKDIPALIEGDYGLLLPDHPDIYAYKRTAGRDICLILLNFTGHTVECPDDCFIPVGGEVLVNNYPGITEKNGAWQLKPYQALVCRLQA
jgi:oligo-1,6-glucosidase